MTGMSDIARDAVSDIGNRYQEILIGGDIEQSLGDGLAKIAVLNVVSLEEPACLAIRADARHGGDLAV